MSLWGGVGEGWGGGQDNQSGMLLVDILVCGGTVTAECYCSALQRLWQAINHKRPSLTYQDIIILYDHVRSTLPTMLQSDLHPVISISSDTFRSIRQASTLQQKPTWSTLSPSGYRHLTTVCVWQDANLPTVEQIVERYWFLCGYLMTTVCYPCVMYTLRSEQTSWHQCLLSCFF